MENLENNLMAVQLVEKNSLNNEIDEFVEQTKEAKAIDLAHCLEIMVISDKYFNTDGKEISKKQKKEYGKELKKILKEKLKDSDNLTSDEKKKLWLKGNYLLVTLKTMPIDLKGENLDRKKTVRFIKKIYKKRYE